MTLVDPYANSRAAWTAWQAGRARILGTNRPLHHIDWLTLTNGLERLHARRDWATTHGATARDIDRLDGWIATVKAQLMKAER